jgi:hypothetical protein
MAAFRAIEVGVDEAARLLHVQPSTVRRRLRSGELRKGSTPSTVELSPESWIRVEDTAALLSVTPATVRAAIGRGELAGTRERSGRWRVRLESVLADRRADRDVVARFGGEPTVDDDPGLAGAPPATRHRMRRPVYLQLDADEVDLLELGKDQFGSFRAAIVAGLRAVEADGASTADVAELRVERDLYRDQALEARERAAVLTELARRGLVDELYCPTCDELVPIGEAGYQADADGTVVIFHEPHGLRAGGRMRSSSVLGRRRPLAVDAEPEPTAA